MDEDYPIVSVEKPDETIKKAIGGGIHQFNAQQVGDNYGRSICFVIYTAEQEILGGLIAETHWNWLFIKLLWLNEQLRGRGYGHRLLSLAENEARQQGVKHAYLDTFSFQAPEFYRRHGYEVFGVLEDFPPGHRRYFLKKQLL